MPNQTTTKPTTHTGPLTIQAHVTNLTDAEAAVLKRLLAVFTDPQDKLTRSGLMTGQLLIRVVNHQKIQFIPTGHN